MTSSLFASRSTSCATEGIEAPAPAGKLACTSEAARRPLASATRSRGVAMRWRTRLISLSMSPAFLRASTSRAWVNVSARSSLIICWRLCSCPILSKGSLIQRRNSRPPMGLRVLSSTHKSDPLTDPLRPLSKSSRLRRVWASRVINPEME